ncbi:MAG: hypothetical protein ACI8RD_004407 [Bacillariaceae sp.]|jgi:hypothetical protein
MENAHQAARHASFIVRTAVENMDSTNPFYEYPWANRYLLDLMALDGEYIDKKIMALYLCVESLLNVMGINSDYISNSNNGDDNGMIIDDSNIDGDVNNNDYIDGNNDQGSDNNNSNDNNNNSDVSDGNNDEDVIMEAVLEMEKPKMKRLFGIEALLAHEPMQCCMYECSLTACAEYIDNEGQCMYYCYDCILEDFEGWSSVNDNPVTESVGERQLQLITEECCSINVVPEPVPFRTNTTRIDDLLPFRTLSINDRPQSQASTPSQVGRHPHKIGIAQHLKHKGPYISYVKNQMEAVQRGGVQIKRTVNMGKGKRRRLHCILLRSSGTKRIPTPIWNAEVGKLELDHDDKFICEKRQIVFLNEWWEYLEKYCKIHGTLNGHIQFSSWHILSLCHLHECENWNHKCMELLGCNCGRNGCPGPLLGCRHGEHGVECMIPGHYCTGIRMHDIPRIDLLVKKINITLPISNTSNHFSLPLPTVRQGFEDAHNNICGDLPVWDTISDIKDCVVCKRIKWNKRSTLHTTTTTTTPLISITNSKATNQCRTCGVWVCNNHMEQAIHMDRLYYEKLRDGVIKRINDQQDKSLLI